MKKKLSWVSHSYDSGVNTVNSVLAQIQTVLIPVVALRQTFTYSNLHPAMA